MDRPAELAGVRLTNVDGKPMLNAPHAAYSPFETIGEAVLLVETFEPRKRPKPSRWFSYPCRMPDLAPEVVAAYDVAWDRGLKRDAKGDRERLGR